LGGSQSTWAETTVCKNRAALARHRQRRSTRYQSRAAIRSTAAAGAVAPESEQRNKEAARRKQWPSPKQAHAPRASMTSLLTQKCWVPSKTKVWELASILEQADGKLEVQVDGQPPRSIKEGEATAWDPSHDLDLDDLSAMNQLHEAPLLAARGAARHDARGRGHY